MREHDYNQKILKLSMGEKFRKHILSNEKINEMVDVQARIPITTLPVCGCCEKLALWHKDKQGRRIAQCTNKGCGTVTYNAITLAEYMVAGYDQSTFGNEELKEAERVGRSLIV